MSAILAILAVGLVGAFCAWASFYFSGPRKPKGFIDTPVKATPEKPYLPTITDEKVRGLVARPSRKASSDAVYGKGPNKVRPKALPARVYHLPRGLSRSEAFRKARKMDPTRKHAAFAYDKATGVAHSMEEGALD